MRSHLLLVLAVLLLGGCAAPGTQTPPSSPTPQPFPTYPTDLTAETAGSYTSDFEEVYRHNAILATADTESITSITASCSPSDVTETGDGYRVTVECGFGWMFEQDGSVGVADGVPYRATYRIGGSLIERVGSTLGE